VLGDQTIGAFLHLLRNFGRRHLRCFFAMALTPSIAVAPVRARHPGAVRFAVIARSKYSGR
jgi:hypothetical protein